MKSKSKYVLGGAAAGVAVIAAVVGLNTLPSGMDTSSDETAKQVFDAQSYYRLDEKLLAMREMESASKEEFQYFVSTAKKKDSVGTSLPDVTGEEESDSAKDVPTASEEEKEEETKETEKETAGEEKDTEADWKEQMAKDLVLADPGKADPYLNIRAVADTDGEVLGRLYPGDGGTLLETDSGWAKVKSGSVEGWVFADCLLYGEDAMEVSEEQGYGQMVAVLNSDASMNIRQKKSVNSAIIDMVTPDERYEVVEITEDWIGIQYNELTVGYLSAPYVSVEYAVGDAVSMEEERRKEEEARLAAEAEAARQAEEAARQQAETQAAQSQAASQAQTPAASQPQFSGNQQTALNYTQQSPVALTAQQRTLMAAVVQTEAGSRACEGQLAVANVILNRLRSGIWGNTLEGVLYAPYQFTCVTNGAVDQAMAAGISAAAYNAVDQACAGVNNIDDYMYFCSQRKAQPGLYVKYVLVNGNCFYRKG